MPADALLSRLEGVRRTGPSRWLARCPAHDDRRPSLSIRELDDGRLLIHDFGGCDVETVLGAAGLEIDALFPERLTPGAQRGPTRRPFSAADALRCISFEVLVAQVAAATLARGEALSDEDRDRLALAADRLRGAVEACGL